MSAANTAMESHFSSGYPYTLVGLLCHKDIPLGGVQLYQYHMY
jgi:hypothetical protein